MKDIIDNFSDRAKLYARYRPEYPDALYDFILELIEKSGIATDNAWVCATGNGQVAKILSKKFKTVFASDISKTQIDNAFELPNIKYSVQRAENTDFINNYFDLITVAQAIHWFDFDNFYKEAFRVAKSRALIAVWGYNQIYISQKIDKIVNKLYYDIVGKYWNSERLFVEKRYKTIPFPFFEIKPPEIDIKCNWSVSDLIGYLSSWSAVNKYNIENNKNPIELIEKELIENWGNEENRKVIFPIFARIGFIKK